MSVLRKTVKDESENVSMDWRKFLLPGYIIFSALFILFTLYNALWSVVYQSGLQAGVAEWQQQWYEIGMQEILQTAGNSCETITIGGGDQQVGLVNIACLQQQAPAEASAPIVEWE